MKYLYTLFVFLISLPGCEVIKAKRSASTDSVHVSKSAVSAIDTTGSGQVSKTETKSKEDFDWYRMTQLIEQAKPGDPKVVVVEGGRGTREQTSTGIDSNWVKNYLSYQKSTSDSASKQTEVTEKDKHSETKGLGAFMVVLICIGVLVAYIIIDKGFISKFKMVRR